MKLVSMLHVLEEVLKSCCLDFQTGIKTLPQFNQSIYAKLSRGYKESINRILFSNLCLFLVLIFSATPSLFIYLFNCRHFIIINGFKMSKNDPYPGVGIVICLIYPRFHVIRKGKLAVKCSVTNLKMSTNLYFRLSITHDNTAIKKYHMATSSNSFLSFHIFFYFFHACFHLLFFCLSKQNFVHAKKL